MKGVILFGSPRKDGNTMQLVRAFAEALEGCGHDMRMVYLNDIEIRPCQGCLACLPEGDCPIDDDMAEVKQYVLESDLMVYATPIYWYGPSGQMKLFMDRSIAFEDGGFNSRIRGKKAVTLMTCGDETPGAFTQTREMLEKTFNLLGLTWAGNVEATGCHDKGPVKQKFLEEAKNLARSLP